MTERPDYPQPPDELKKVYLGDGVYAAFDGWHIVLTAENGWPPHQNTIFVEPGVFNSLTEYAGKVWKPAEPTEETQDQGTT